MKKMIITWVVLLILLVGTLTFIGYRYSDSRKIYYTLENDIIEAGDTYLKVNEMTLGVNDKIKLTTKQLKDADFLTNSLIDEEICKGYIIIEKTLKNYNFDAYIKCAEYTTNGYEE